MEMAAQGQMQTPEVKAHRHELTRTGKLSGYTLSRFMDLLVPQPAAPSANLWVPGNCEFEIQVSDIEQGVLHSRTIIMAGQQGTIVSVRLEGGTTETWRVGASGQLPANLPLIGTQIPRRESDKCNQWLFVEYFDKQRTNLKVMVDEWLHIRKTQDYKEQPLNPLRSMQTAISEEKKRRQERQES